MSVSREQFVESGRSQVQQADLSEAQLTSELSEFAFNTAQVLQQKANHNYELEFRNQAQESLHSIYDKNISNPNQFNIESKALENGLIKNAPMHLRPQFRQVFKQQTQPYLNKVTRNHEIQLNDEIKFNTLKRLDLAKQSATVYANGLFSGDPVQAADSSMALQELVMDSLGALTAVDGRGIPVLSASERFRLSKDFIDDIAFSSVRAGFDDAVDKEAYLQRFESGELKASIFIDENGEFIERSVKDAMERPVYERTINYMETDITRIKQAAVEQQAMEQQAQLIDLVKNNEYILDPYNKEHQAAVNADYVNFASQINELPANEQIQAHIGYVSQVGIMPKVMESNITAMLRNGSVSQKTIAANILDKIASENPQVTRQIKEKDRVFAAKIAANLEAGIEPELAVEYAGVSAYDKDSDLYKFRQNSFKDDAVEFSSSFVNELFRDDPNDIPPGMKAEYERLNRTYYVEGNLDADKASELAKERIKQNWGISDIGGRKRWMKYAPEKIYDNGLGSEWISEQLVSELTANAIIPGSSNFEESLILEVDPNSRTQPDPDYLVFYIDEETGVPINMINENGSPILFKPDFQQSPMYKRILEENDNSPKQTMIALNRMRQRNKQRQIIKENIQSVREGF